MKRIHKEEKGLAIVEAAILIPFCMIIVIALYYAAIFLCQRANLQANLQSALTYYKNVESDTFLETVNAESGGEAGSGGLAVAGGTGYGEPDYLFPYRFLGGIGQDSRNFDESAFDSFFRCLCGYMFFDDGSNVELEAHEENYVAYRTITAAATQTVKPAISLAMVGAADEMTIEVTGRAVVTDGDELIRNLDFAVDLVMGSRLGEKIEDLKGKVGEIYGKFKEIFHVN